MPTDEFQKFLKLPFHEAEEQLFMFDSYARTAALTFVLLRAPTAADQLNCFLNWGNMCDAPWHCRSTIAEVLRKACSSLCLADHLGLRARALYEGLPEVVSVWRGCEKGRERGLSWTLDRAIAERFAMGQRCINKKPTIVRADVQKPHIFAIFVNRGESEIVLDPRRLRKLQSNSHQMHTTEVSI